MKQPAFKTNGIPARRKSGRPGKTAARLLLICLSAICLTEAAFAQAKQTSTAVKPAGAVLPTPTPTPTPATKPASSAPAGATQTKSPASLPAVQPPSPGGTNAPGAKSNALAGDVGQMTQQQFRALPSTANLSYKGQSMTKAAFIEQRRKELRAHAKNLQTKANIKFAAARSQFQRQQALDLAARNARVKAVAESYDRRMKQLAASADYSALSKEANDIVQRYPSASSAEKAKLKQRAVEVHTQLLKMEQAAATGH